MKHEITSVKVGIEPSLFKWSGKKWTQGSHSFRSLRELKVFAKRNKRTLFVDYVVQLPGSITTVNIEGGLTL